MAYDKATVQQTKREREYLTRLLRTMIPRPAGPQVCGIVDHKLVQFIPELAEAFTESKFIWLVRDGRKVVASAYARGWYSKQEGQFPNHAWAKYRLQGDEVDEEILPEDWGVMSPFEKCCWYWKWTQEQIRDGLEKVPIERSDVYLVEELEGGLTSLQQFVGVKPVELEMQRANVGQKVSSPMEWNQGKHNVFEVWCGGEMDVFYPDWRLEDESTRTEV